MQGLRVEMQLKCPSDSGELRRTSRSATSSTSCQRRVFAVWTRASIARVCVNVGWSSRLFSSTATCFAHCNRARQLRVSSELRQPLSGVPREKLRSPLPSTLASASAGHAEPSIFLQSPCSKWPRFWKSPIYPQSAGILDLAGCWHVLHSNPWSLNVVTFARLKPGLIPKLAA